MLQLLAGVSGHSDVGMKRKPLQASTTRFLLVHHGGRRAQAGYRMTGARIAGDKLLDGGRGIAGQEWHLLGHGVGRARLLGQPTSPAQKAKHIVVDLLQDLGHLFVRGRGEIALQRVRTHTMPPGGNITDLSDDDRRVIAAWLAAGAPGN